MWILILIFETLWPYLTAPVWCTYDQCESRNWLKWALMWSQKHNWALGAMWCFSGASSALLELVFHFRTDSWLNSCWDWLFSADADRTVQNVSPPAPNQKGPGWKTSPAGTETISPQHNRGMWGPLWLYEKCINTVKTADYILCVSLGLDK